MFQWQTLQGIEYLNTKIILSSWNEISTLANIYFLAKIADHPGICYHLQSNMLTFEIINS